ncbi:MAG: Aldehyde dehydrogenase, partial [uncultured Solirubrobacteraceae bacterium]
GDDGAGGPGPRPDLHRRRVGAVERHRRPRGGQLGHGAGDGVGPGGHGGRRRPRGGRRARGVRLVVADLGRRARGVDGPDRRGARRAHGGDRRPHRPGGGHAGQARPHDPGGPADDGLRRDAAAHGRDRVGGGGRQLADRPRARRRRRRDHAVELPAAPDLREGSPGARGGLHRRAQAVGGRAAQRVPARRPARRARAAGRGLQPGDGRRARGGGGDRGASRRRHGLLHRVDGGRAARERGGVADGQARRPRARRQVAERHPRGRAARGGHHRRRLEVLPELGADLQRPDADARPARAAAGGRGDRRGGGRALQAGRPVRPRDDARAARLRRPARPRARLHPHGPGGGGEARARRRGRARGARAGLLRAPDGLLGGHPGHDDRPGGDLRTRARDHALRRRGGRDPDRQRHRLRARGRRLVGRRGARQGGRAADPDGAGRDQRRGLQPAGAVRRLQAVGPRARAGALRPRGVPPGQVDAAV